MLPLAKKVYDNPSKDGLRAMVARMPNACLTEFGNYNVTVKVLARSKSSTFIVDDNSFAHSDQCMSRNEYDHVARLQDVYIAEQEMIRIDGCIGSDPTFRVPTCLYIEKRNANIAAMQQQLYYPPSDPVEDPLLTVIYTPNLPMPGYPNDRLIAVDLVNNVTRVFNSDYFGESKKGGLRMWNKVVYDRGGIPLHAGCKVVPSLVGKNGEKKTLLIIGLSGTGKTTTTFSKQNASLPMQDDFLALLPDGSVYATEDGCFAKTFGLDPDFEPAIYQAVTRPDAYLENVSQTETTIDFFDTTYTQNGRSTFEFSAIEHYEGSTLNADSMLILNRNENVIPAIAKLTTEQAAAYFMLGETTGTSAGGAEEAGRFLRVPGTNPFFPLCHEQQGNRMLEILRVHSMDVYLLNTGCVGGKKGQESAKDITIMHSSACVKGIADGTIEWETDPDFGYQVAVSVPGLDDEEVLQPRKLYERTGRRDEYQKWVTRLKSERVQFLKGFEGVEDVIVEAVS